MLREIQTTYQAEGRQADLSRLISNLVSVPLDTNVGSPEFNSNEVALHHAFFQFTDTRRVAVTRNYTAHFGTKRWEVVAYDPIRLLSDPHSGNLNVIPFREYDEGNYYMSHLPGESDEFYPTWRPPTVQESFLAARAIGFYLTPYSPRKVLNHAIMTHPWFRSKSTHIGIARRYTPPVPGTPREDIRFQQGNQRKFGAFLAELIEWETTEGSSYTDS